MFNVVSGLLALFVATGIYTSLMAGAIAVVMAGDAIASPHSDYDQLDSIDNCVLSQPQAFLAQIRRASLLPLPQAPSTLLRRVSLIPL